MKVKKMNNFSEKILKPFATNFFILFFFIALIELIFGYWFDKDNLGPYMREHRMKNQPIIYTYEGKTTKYNYKRNYYGFRGDDIEPSEIQAIIMGGSNIDERYKPDQFTITGYLNKNLEKNNYDLKIINAGIEAQSSVGMIFNFRNWFPKLKNFSPKIILFYIGVNDIHHNENTTVENLTAEHDGLGHMINPEKIEFFFDNVKSRSFLYDTARIFKFKYLPRKNFVKYDGNIEPDQSDYEFFTYEKAIEKYDISELKIKNKEVIKNYLDRIDILYEESKKLNSKPIFITTIGAEGHTEIMFMLNHTLINHCKIKKYNCIDPGKKMKSKISYWRGLGHTSKEGSEAIANLITEDLLKFIEK